MQTKKFFTLLHFIIFTLLLSSCISTKKLTYFDNKDEINTALSKTLYDAKIMPKDILQIQVFTMTPEAAVPFNLLKLTGGSISTTSSTGQGTVYDYLVDNDGNIEYPVLGTLHLGGLSKTEAEQLIKSKIQPYLAESENVVVHVRMMNYKYAILGGVNRPGVFTTPNEKVSILEAIAQAGDLTTFAYRDRIFLIRENACQYHQFTLLLFTAERCDLRRAEESPGPQCLHLSQHEHLVLPHQFPHVHRHLHHRPLEVNKPEYARRKGDL